MATFDARDLDLDIDKQSLKKLYEVSPFRVLAALALEWIIIMSAIFFCWKYFNAFTYIAAVILIGSRMHALAVIMHDIAHFRFLRNRKLSDFIANTLICWPMMIDVESYRQNHLDHHQKLNTSDDPDWTAKVGKKSFEFPQTKLGFYKTLFLYLIGYQGIADLAWMAKRMSGKKKSANQKLQMRIYLITLITLLSIFSGWKFYLLFWVVPFFTAFLMFQYLRSFAEHFGKLKYTNLLDSTRSVIPSFFEKVIVAPYNISYHLEHHLYPGVPYYNLPKLRKMLLKQPFFKKHAHFTHGYFNGLMKELR